MQLLVLRKTLESISLDHRSEGESAYEGQTESMKNVEVGSSKEDKVDKGSPEEAETRQ